MHQYSLHKMDGSSTNRNKQHYVTDMKILEENKVFFRFRNNYFQCFNAAGWAAGRASSL